jgi:hypothetical protein
MLKKVYHSDNSHVIAHNNVMQQIRKGGMDNLIIISTLKIYVFWYSGETDG